MNQMASMVGPLMMSHANALRPGSMTSGMGIIEGGALGDAASPAFGRTINLGAEAERAVANMPLPRIPPAPLAQSRTGPPNEGMVPGYPQDMFMVMDDLVAKPETYGMRRGWSGWRFRLAHSNFLSSGRSKVVLKARRFLGKFRARPLLLRGPLGPILISIPLPSRVASGPSSERPGP